MHALLLTGFAFLTGLTACGLVSTVLELSCGRRLAFVEPYVSSHHVVRSLAATAVAGPFMLLNDALAARREGRISSPGLLSCVCTAMLWALALGVVIRSVAFMALGLPAIELPAI
jgi:hypothetical protein